jgi:isoleucyl-tRNA synthetase
VIDDGEHYWIATERISSVFDNEPDVVATATGAALLGVGYEPPFDYFGEERDKGAFRVIPSDDVTVDEGTGLVHMAPAYGEADFLALQSAGLTVLVDPVDSGGSFTDEVPDVAGQNIKEADPALIALLRESGKLVHAGQINHSYPFCYRTGTPLIYKAIPTWFVAVERFRDRMVELNDNIHWVPDYVGSRRFGNWLANARDWAISRNRYWGSCIPVWQCDNCDESVAVGSVDELEGYSGERPDDLHKHFIDKIGWDCASCSGYMVRVPEVLDCWFESGSMPYGKLHYPFENKERFDATYPAQFIAEGLDQTRGWFYTLVVLSTALFDEPAFENCVVNGLILAEDGRKMSKSLKNYPDPSDIFDDLGADALRAFLINSPVLRAEPLRFSKEGVAEVVRTVLLPLWHTYSFFTTYAEADMITVADLASAPPPSERPEMDRWILSVLQSLVSEVNTQMEGYYLYNVVPPTLGFIDHLTKWYVRRSRRRFWNTRGVSGESDANKLSAFATLYEVLTTFVEVLAPVLPFMTEHLYQDLVARHHPEVERSVHHRDFPQADPALIDTELESAMAVIREVVRQGRNLRKKEGLRVRQPLASLTVLTHDPEVIRTINEHSGTIAEELNIKEITATNDELELVELSAKANYRKLGPVLGPKMAEVAKEIASFGGDEVAALLNGETVGAGDQVISLEDVAIERTPKPGKIVESGADFACALDTTLDDALISEGLARELISKAQRTRRDADLDVSDRITLKVGTSASKIVEAIDQYRETIAAEILANEIQVDSDESGTKTDVAGHDVWLSLTT